jgi:chromosome segregation ATPase
MTFHAEKEIQIHDYIKREEYREDITRIESRVNSLAESQAMASVAMQNMNVQLSQTNKKIDDFAKDVSYRLENIDGNLEKIALNQSFKNGAVTMLIKTMSIFGGTCAILLTFDYVGLIKAFSKWASS